MTRAISYDRRVKILRDRALGKTIAVLAAENFCSTSAVKDLLNRQKEMGKACLVPAYVHCGKSSRAHFSPAVVEAVLAYRERSFGAPYVNSQLGLQFPQERIPDTRTIQRMWKKAGNPRSKSHQKTVRRGPWSKKAGETWQIDGKEQIELADGSQVSWLNVADEASSAALQTTVFPPAHGV